MSPAYLLELISRRLTRSPRVAAVSDAAVYRLPGALDGYGEGRSVFVRDEAGITFRVTVTLHSLGIEGDA